MPEGQMRARGREQANSGKREGFPRPPLPRPLSRLDFDRDSGMPRVAIMIPAIANHLRDAGVRTTDMKRRWP